MKTNNLIKPGDLFTYKPIDQYKNVIRFLLFMTNDNVVYILFDPITKTVHLVDYAPILDANLELL